MNDLESMYLCSGFCQMVGAASAVLSINNTVVIFNSPRWCALTAERELMKVNRDYEDRLFCTEARQDTLVYGVEAALNETLEEASAKVEKAEMIAVLTSCSMGLIGDDIKGIAARNIDVRFLLSIDAGGLTGNFISGYTMAFLKVLQSLDFISFPRNNKVNLIGVCTCYPHWQGNVEEMTRILSLAGIEVNIILGSDDTDLQAIRRMTTAALNIVLDRDLGLPIAKYLEENYKQQYVVAEWPIGFKATEIWLRKICSILHINDGCQKLEQEILMLQGNIEEHCSWVEHNINDYFLNKIVLYMPGAIGQALANALKDSNIDLFVCKAVYVINTACNYTKWNGFENINEDFSCSDGVLLLFGSDRERIIFRDFPKVIYFDFGIPASRCCSCWNSYVGVHGWQNFVSDFTNQLIGLYLR